MARVRKFIYYQAPRDKSRGLRPFQLRDELAGDQVCLGLFDQGFRLGESILNTPPSDPRDREIRKIDLGEVEAGDAFLLTTRPPKDDERQGDKKRVARGYTDLEETIFQAFDPYISLCARSHLTLHPRLAPLLRPGGEGFADMEFTQNPVGAPLSSWNACDGSGWKSQRGKGLTALFLLRTRPLWKRGPELVCAFGMDGLSTLVWAYRLGHDLRALLQERHFVVARAKVGPVPERPFDLTWAAEWPIEVVLDVPALPLEGESRMRAPGPAPPASRSRRAGLTLRARAPVKRGR